jgi:hypothetical protein
MEVLKKWRARPSMCTLWHAAVVSRSYKPSIMNAFLKRDADLDQNDSGWYVGVADDSLDVNDPSNLALQSLYELSIHDARFTPYWLLPAGYVIQFTGPNASIKCLS